MKKNALVGTKMTKALCEYKDVKVECAAKDGVVTRDCPLSH